MRSALIKTQTMATYKIPIIWQTIKTFEVEANTLQEAVDQALKTFYAEPCTDGDYLEDSAEIDSIIDDDYPDEEYNSHFEHVTPVKEPAELLTTEQRENLLAGALEGGSNYWYWLPDLTMTDGYYRPYDATAETIMKTILADGIIPVFDVDDKNEFLGQFSLQSIRKGEALMKENAPGHWDNIINENDDAETADVWFQYCVLGDIVYG